MNLILKEFEFIYNLLTEKGPKHIPRRKNKPQSSK